MLLSTFERGLLEALYDSDDVGLVLLDTNLHYVKVNDTLAELNGIPASEHEGRSIREVLGDLADLVEPAIKQVMASRQPLTNLDLSGPTAGDPTADRHFHGGYYPVMHEGEVIGVGALIIEVTQKVRIEQEIVAQARTIYESVVQDLTIAQLALDEDEHATTYQALSRALRAAKRIASKSLLTDIVPPGD